MITGHTPNMDICVDDPIATPREMSWRKYDREAFLKMIKQYNFEDLRDVEPYELVLHGKHDCTRMLSCVPHDRQQNDAYESNRNVPCG